MLASWAIEELAEVNLGDKRLNDRLRHVLSQLGRQPTASIPVNFDCVSSPIFWPLQPVELPHETL